MSNNIKSKDTFDSLSFSDVFDTFDDEYLTDMAESSPEQLARMCLFLTLDYQLLNEKSQKKLDKRILN